MTAHPDRLRDVVDAVIEALDEGLDGKALAALVPVLIGAAEAMSAVSLNAVATSDKYRPDGKNYDIRLKTPYDGLHRVETLDGGDHPNL